MKTIKKYIQFAIDNELELEEGKALSCKYNKKELWITIQNKIEHRLVINYNEVELITSKEFIEAIAKGIYMGDSNIIEEDEFYPLVEEITIEQAIAIRDDKLDLFINELLGKTKKQ